MAFRPDLGITVRSVAPANDPTACLTGSLGSWRLEYGVGDFPQMWFPINVPGLVRKSALCVGRSGPSYYRHTEVASGHGYLQTDTLINDQFYTIRLVARNRAGREFIAYDSIIPMRAKLILPSHNTSIVGRWGWAPISGFADIRSNEPGTLPPYGANYQLQFAGDAGLLWSSPFFPPAGKYDTMLAWATANNSGSLSSYQDLPALWGTSASAFMGLMKNRESVPGFTPLFPSTALAPDSYAEGWVQHKLWVWTVTLDVDSDSVRLYLDNSHFPYKTGWPVNLPTGLGRSPGGILVTDMGGGLGRRIFIHTRLHFGCLDANGNVCPDASGTPNWSLRLPFDRPLTERQTDPPGFAVDDVDLDGVKEILVSGTKSDQAATTQLAVYLLRADGTTYPGSWPKLYPYVNSGNFKASTGKLHIADVTGDSEKELIFYQRPINYYGILSQQITPGYLHVLDKQGNPACPAGPAVCPWPMQFLAEQKTLPMQVGDVDGDGKAEILLKPDRILKGDGGFMTGWDTAINSRASARLFNLDTSPGLDVIQYVSKHSVPHYQVTLMDAAGNPRWGWPITYNSDVTEDPTDPYSRRAALRVTAGQVVTGGDAEIVLCDNRIRVYNTSAQRVTATPEIDLMGHCGGIELVDMDGDGNPDSFIVLVHRFRRDVPDDFRRGSFVEAYAFDGTRLADNDNRWPIVVSVSQWYWYGPSLPSWNGRIAFGDLDGDNVPEAVQVMDSGPYPGESGQNATESRVEVLALN